MIDKSSSIARFLVVSAAFVIVVSGLKMAGPLLVPFLLAVFIAMIVSPLLAVGSKITSRTVGIGDFVGCYAYLVEWVYCWPH